MAVIGVDLGGTKLAVASFDRSGSMLDKKVTALQNRTGKDVGQLIVSEIDRMIKRMRSTAGDVTGIGICVPGIYHAGRGSVWAPNIPEWENYPLQKEVAAYLEDRGEQLPVRVESDRACYILGETWKGAARGCKNAIFLAVGTGIGAGILCDGKVLRGHGDIAGATGWMTLHPEFDQKYASCGYFEFHASGKGIVTITRDLLKQNPDYDGQLRQKELRDLSTRDIFMAHEHNDPIAGPVIRHAITCWGMAVANFVSLLNPEKIIIGGGVFGPAAVYLNDIEREAARWAQPISMKQVRIEVSALGGDAGLTGAGKLAID